MNELDFIDECVEKVKKYRNENEILKKLLYEIRTETQRCDLAETNYDSMICKYRPIRNTRKNDIYRSYMRIKHIVKGHYRLLTNESAIDELIERGIKNDNE